MSSRTRENSFYDSDSFESDTEYTKKGTTSMDIEQRPAQTKNQKINNAYKQHSANVKSRQRNNNRKLFPQKRFNPAELEVAAQRVLSARKHQITNQNNLIHELQKQIENIQAENKTLKTQTHLQEKALNKIDNKQSDLPKILEQHLAEMLSMKEQLRRTKDLLNNEVSKRKECDGEILKLRSALNKANALVTERNLGERSALQTQLKDAQDKLETSEKMLEATNKHLENLEKSHKREIHALKKQVKHCESQCREYLKELDQVKLNLKEKEKLLEIQNIYSHRIKIPHRLPTTTNDSNICGTCSGLNNDQLVDKLNIGNMSSKENSFNKNPTQPISVEDTSNTRFLDPEKIKDDIRKILEEEILSGRIKPVESPPKDSNIVSPRTMIIERDSPLLDSFNSSRIVDSEVFDKETTTQVQSIIDEDPKPDTTPVINDLKQKDIILAKLNSMEIKYSLDTDLVKNEPLKYSYPNDRDFVDNETSLNEIETISTTDVKKPAKSYKFTETIENLHHGLPVHLASDKNVKRRMADSNKPAISSKNELMDTQIGLVLSQKNNSNTEDEFLPPLTEIERQNKERELLGELFGQYQSNGIVKSRNTTLPWDSNESDKSKISNSPPSIRSRSLDKSEDIEEIML